MFISNLKSHKTYEIHESWNRWKMLQSIVQICSSLSALGPWYARVHPRPEFGRAALPETQLPAWYEKMRVLQLGEMKGMLIVSPKQGSKLMGSAVIR